MKTNIQYTVGNKTFNITAATINNKNFHITAGAKGTTPSYQFNPVYSNSVGELPNVGNLRTMYIVGDGEYRSVYMWDNNNFSYYLVANNYNEIDTIDGGNSNE